MAQVVAVHGIGQQFHNKDKILSAWLPAITGSFELVDHVEPVSVEIAFYGDLYRRQGTMASAPSALSADNRSDYETALLIELWTEAARTNTGVVPPDAETMLYVPDSVRRACNALAGIPFISGMVSRTAILWFVNQVYRYFHEPELRAEARRRVAAKVGPDTRVMVAHSLGSVVAYEELCAHPEWPVNTFITLGSPLGIRNLIFHRLDPAPSDGVGGWPSCIHTWTNVSARGDIVALERRLSSLFGARVTDIAVDNAWDAHDAERYLTAKEVAEAIRNGLTNGLRT